MGHFRVTMGTCISRAMKIETVKLLNDDIKENTNIVRTNSAIFGEILATLDLEGKSNFKITNVKKKNHLEI